MTTPESVERTHRTAASGSTRSRTPSRRSATGRPVVVVDDEDRENEGDLIFAAQRATPELAGFMIRWTSGYICVAMPGRDLDRLGLPPMTLVNEDKKGTAYAVTVDARDVKATGISAEDRARTIKVLSDSATEPWELTRPGHVVPAARDGGRRAAPSRSHRGRRRPRPPRRADAGRRALRARQRRRLDDARARSAGSSPTSTTS